MATTKTRLNKLDGTLTPEQAFAAFLKEIHRFDSPRTYRAAALAQPKIELSPWPVARRIMATVQERMKGRPINETRKAIRLTVRRFLFLSFLFALTIDDFDSRLKERLQLGALAVETYASALSQTLLDEEFSEANDGSFEANDVGPLDRAEKYFRRFAKEVLTTEATIEALQNQYFNGRKILWDSQKDHLEALLKLLDLTAIEWQELADEIHDFLKVHILKLRLRGKIKEVPLSLIPKELKNFTDLRKSIDPSKRVRALVNSAKIATLEVMGQRERALDFMRAELRR